MRVRRGFLFWGLFLIPLGAIPLLVRGGYLDEDLLTNAWQLWPLILVGLGIALLLGRSQAGLVGTIVIALTLGGIGGAAIATGPSWIGSISDCAPVGADTEQLSANGAFGGPASVTVDLDCGSVDLVTAAGSGWTATAAYRGPEPRVESSGTSLTLRDPSGTESHRQEWEVTVGADALRDISLTVNAAASTVTLDGAALASMRADLNAGDLLLDASGATVATLDLSVNAGRIRVTLGDGATTGELDANAGGMELCVPADAGLELQVDEQLTFATNLDDRGLTRSGETWTRPATGGPVISLEISGNAASFTLDPDGGCK